MKRISSALCVLAIMSFSATSGACPSKQMTYSPVEDKGITLTDDKQPMIVDVKKTEDVDAAN